MSGMLDYFLPYQVAWIDEPAPFAGGEKSRRIGWTYASSFRQVQRRVQKKGHGYYSSADLTAAKEFVEYCRMWAGVFNVVAKETLEEEVIDDQKINSLVLTFDNGFRIVVGSSNPKFFRSKGGDADLDEFAYHNDPPALLKAAHATAIFWGYQLRFWSTHHGEGNYFNRLIQDGRKYMAAREAGQLGNYKGLRLVVHRTTILDAVEQGIVEKIKKLKARDDKARQEWLDEMRSTCADEDTWNEEYLCQPSTDEASLLSYPLIRRCEEPNLPANGELAHELDAGKQYYAGFDVGRKRDLSVLWVLEKIGDIYWTRRVRVMDRMDFTAQEQALNELMTHRGIKRLCIDATGIGAMLAERLEQRWGQHRAEGVVFTAPVKSELAMPLLRLFQDRLIRIPAEDRVRNDLHSVRKIVTAANNVRLDADRDTDGHADRFWALSLAYHAADDLKMPLPPPAAHKPFGW